MGSRPNGIPTGDDRESFIFMFASRIFSSLMLRVARLGLH